MAKLRWLIWGIVFSSILFMAIYFLIYKRIVFSEGTAVLMLGNMDVSSLGVFFSDIKNVILSSLVLGFLLGILTNIGFKKKDASNQIPQN